MIFYEDSRNQLVSRSKQGKKENDGKTRFQKRLNSRVASSNTQYNQINMDQFFKEDILTIGIHVKGETDNYVVGISYGGILDALKQEIKRNEIETVELRNIVRALIIAFNREEVFIKCSCPDWKYRFDYWANKNSITFGDKQTEPSDETNPDDNLGPACKHVLLVLSNTSWIIKVASVIMNYIKYMQNHMKKAYADIIHPAVYGKKYEEPVQLTIFDDEQDNLDSNEETIDNSNVEARRRGQFKQGNEYRFRPKKDEDDKQLTLDDVQEQEEEESDE